MKSSLLVDYVTEIFVDSSPCLCKVDFLVAPCAIDVVFSQMTHSNLSRGIDVLATGLTEFGAKVVGISLHYC